MRDNQECFFVTLTYADSVLPDSGTLNPDDVKKYIKRLRKNTGVKLRYFLVGEYGEKTHRPHYHIIFFTNGGIKWELPPPHKKMGQNAIINSDFHRCWLRDSIVDARIIPSMDDGISIARYCAGYVLKKLTSEKTMAWAGLKNLHPEFAYMSKKPGIGMNALYRLADGLKKHKVSAPENQRKGDTLTGLYMIRLNGKKWPLSRSMRDNLIKHLGGDKRSSFTKQLAHHMKQVAKLPYDDPSSYDELIFQDEAERKESNYKAANLAKQKRGHKKI